MKPICKSSVCGLVARAAILFASSSLAACGEDAPANDDDHDHDHGTGGSGAGSTATNHRMFVVADGKLKAFELGSGEQVSGEVTNVTRVTDLRALRDGFLLGSLTDDNEVLVVDGKTMLEETRIPASSGGGIRPVHNYVTPTYDGTQYLMVLNDGNGEPEENTVTFIDIGEGSEQRFQAVGEAPLGIGHHKASFSRVRPRVTISNLNDCDKVLQVLDFGDPSDIQEVATFSAEDLGWDGSSTERTCDPTRAAGTVPSPHGAATGQNGKSYHNLTATGEIVEVDMEADEPTFRVISTGRTGGGGGYTTYGFGAYVYTLHTTPREGGDGEVCQIGQLTVLDTMEDEGSVASEIPLFYEGSECTRSLLGTDEEGVGPGHTVIDVANAQIFITPAGPFGDPDARVRQELVLSATDPSSPIQWDSIPIGAGTGHVNDAITGDSEYVLVVGTVDGTVSVIEAETRSVERTVEVGPNPSQVASWGSEEGPSY